MNNKVVYVHKLNSEVVYVGSGCVKRTTNIAGRSEQHKKIWKDLEKVIIADNLSKEDSLELEQQLIDQYVVYGNLLNKSHQASPVKKIIYKDIVDLLEYDESSPTYLRWKIQCRKQTPPGSIAGHFGNFGYCVVQIKGKNYKGHRVVYCLNTGLDLDSNLPIDHVDQDRSNNNFNNLRLVTSLSNNTNKKHKIGILGYQGISLSLTRFRVSWTNEGVAYRESFCFSEKKRKDTKNHYPTRELAFEAALVYRNSLVEQGLIILTNKEEINGINTLATN